MNAVVTIAIGDKYEKIGLISHPTIKAYADKIGADFVPITRIKISKTTPHFEKFQMFEMFDKYERIIYIDTDIIVRPDTPNLFDLVDSSELGAFQEGAFTNRNGCVEMFCRERNLQMPRDYDGAYYNTGVMVLSKEHKYLFEPPADMRPTGFFEQDYLNWLMSRNAYKMFPIPYQYNRMTCMDQYTGEDRHASYLIHYAGAPGDMCQNLMKKDIDIWKEKAPDYKFQRHLLIYVNGGFGDQVSVEPVIRYIVNKAYKGDDINIVTHWSRIFSHIENIKIHEAGNLKLEKDTPYYVMRTIADNNDILTWKYLSHAMIHPVDYASLLMLRRTIPDIDKQIKLKVELSDFAKLFDVIGIRTDLQEMIAVHPGRGWASKTFPKEYWEEIINKLIQDGKKVVVIGKDISAEQGTVQIEVPDGVLDTRNKLGTEELFALLSNVKCLISNDSVPVHISGAFDGHICLIATCKHPDNTLPYRHGKKDYKAIALYKKLMEDEQDNNPTNIEGETIDHIPSGNIMDYLPETDRIIDYIRTI